MYFFIVYAYDGQIHVLLGETLFVSRYFAILLTFVILTEGSVL